MSEKIYALLLKVYPAHFRKACGDEALQLFRDRLNHERGVLPRMRLWLDLLADIVVSVPVEYRRKPPAIEVTAQPTYGIPSFLILEIDTPTPGMLFLGTAIALAVLSSIGLLYAHRGAEAALRVSATSASPAYPRLDFPSGSAMQNPVTAASGGVAGASPGSGHQTRSQHDTATLRIPSEAKLNAAERRQVIDSIIAVLRKHYANQDAVWEISTLLSTQEQSGAYRGITEREVFARVLTAQMRNASRDSGLTVMNSGRTAPVEGGSDSAVYRLDSTLMMAIPRGRDLLLGHD